MNIIHHIFRMSFFHVSRDGFCSSKLDETQSYEVPIDAEAIWKEIMLRRVIGRMILILYAFHQSLSPSLFILLLYFLSLHFFSLSFCRDETDAECEKWTQTETVPDHLLGRGLLRFRQRASQTLAKRKLRLLSKMLKNNDNYSKKEEKHLSI